MAVVDTPEDKPLWNLVYRNLAKNSDIYGLSESIKGKITGLSSNAIQVKWPGGEIMYAWKDFGDGKTYDLAYNTKLEAYQFISPVTIREVYPLCTAVQAHCNKTSDIYDIGIKTKGKIVLITNEFLHIQWPGGRCIYAWKDFGYGKTYNMTYNHEVEAYQFINPYEKQEKDPEPGDRKLTVGDKVFDSVNDIEGTIQQFFAAGFVVSYSNDSHGPYIRDYLFSSLKDRGGPNKIWYDSMAPGWRYTKDEGPVKTLSNEEVGDNPLCLEVGDTIVGHKSYQDDKGEVTKLDHRAFEVTWPKNVVPQFFYWSEFGHDGTLNMEYVPLDYHPNDKNEHRLATKAIWEADRKAFNEECTKKSEFKLDGLAVGDTVYDKRSHFIPGTESGQITTINDRGFSIKWQRGISVFYDWDQLKDGGPYRMDFTEDEAAYQLMNRVKT